MDTPKWVGIDGGYSRTRNVFRWLLYLSPFWGDLAAGWREAEPSAGGESCSTIFDVITLERVSGMIYHYGGRSANLATDS
jgi:hypothetical protein